MLSTIKPNFRIVRMFSDLKCLPLTAGDNEMQSLLKEKQDLEFLR